MKIPVNLTQIPFFGWILCYPKIKFGVSRYLPSLFEHIVSFPLFKSCFSNDSVIINIWWGRTYTYTFFVYSNHYYCSRKLWNPFQVLWETIEGLVLPPIEISYKVRWKKICRRTEKWNLFLNWTMVVCSFFSNQPCKYTFWVPNFSDKFYSYVHIKPVYFFDISGWLGRQMESFRCK